MTIRGGLTVIMIIMEEKSRVVDERKDDVAYDAYRPGICDNEWHCR